MSGKDTTYQRLFESANAAILIISADFIFIDCNEMAAKLLDRPKEEILGKTPADPTISPEIQANGVKTSELGPKYFKSAMEGNDLRFDWLHLKKDGTEFPVEVSLFGFIASDRTIFKPIGLQVTENSHLRVFTKQMKVKTDGRPDCLISLKANQFCILLPGFN